MNKILMNILFEGGFIVRIYYVTKKTIIKILFLIIVIIGLILVTMPYAEAVFNVFKQNHEVPIYSVETDKKVVAITFDCAWGSDDIEELVGILDKYKIKATFFVVGTWLDKYPDKVKLLNKKGHEIANHSDNHLDMTKISEDKIKTEIENLNKKIKQLTGKDNNLFRAPYGEYNNKLIKTAKSIGQYVIQWDVDSLDWKELGVEPIVNRVINKVKNGSIILFHNDTKYSLQALPTVIEKLKARGFEFVKVSDLILKDNFYIDYQGRQHSLIKESGSVD